MGMTRFGFDTIVTKPQDPRLAGRRSQPGGV